MKILLSNLTPLGVFILTYAFWLTSSFYIQMSVKTTLFLNIMYDLIATRFGLIIPLSDYHCNCLRSSKIALLVYTTFCIACVTSFCETILDTTIIFYTLKIKLLMGYCYCHKTIRVFYQTLYRLWEMSSYVFLNKMIF
jgi:hypothetical protein